jgi:hypothetical protein
MSLLKSVFYCFSHIRVSLSWFCLSYRIFCTVSDTLECPRFCLSSRAYCLVWQGHEEQRHGEWRDRDLNGQRCRGVRTLRDKALEGQGPGWAGTWRVMDVEERNSDLEVKSLDGRRPGGRGTLRDKNLERPRPWEWRDKNLEEQGPWRTRI